MVAVVKGIHPTTGEIVFIETHGNFPLKDPVTDMFLLDDKTGEVLFPNRQRVRHYMLDEHGREVLDQRPVAASVMFAGDLTPQEQFQQMLDAAMRKVEDRLARADESNQEFYPTDDDVFRDEDFVDDIDPRYYSPTEFVYSEEHGREIPRGFKLLNDPKASKKPSKPKKDVSATTPAKDASPPSGDANISQDGGDEGA